VLGVTAASRFAELVRADQDRIPLDEVALLISEQADPDADLAAARRQLDRLAEACQPPTLDGLLRLLFIEEGFVGNRSDYYDPRNSLLHEVLERRTGIPISLAVVALEVGRRAGVPLAPIGLPGHFLLRDQVDQDLYIDVYDRGRLLREAQVGDMFRAMQPTVEFRRDFLQPVGELAIVARMLGNLRGVYLQRGDLPALAWVLELLAVLPDAPPAIRRELAGTLERMGRYGEAAGELETIADGSGASRAANDEARARHLRSRLN
jgi:regulator of sirC expression with transglutaminase-like and TPR domain